jgi:hypothetical protein
MITETRHITSSFNEVCQINWDRTAAALLSGLS